MKRQIILTTALSAGLALGAFAQSAAPTAVPSQPAQQPIPPVAPAPPPPPPRGLLHDHDRGPKEPVTFLGVETSEVPRVLSEQMNLPRGFGVVVDYVVPESPAAAAGLQQSDIIRMLNDQIILEPGQLGKLVKSFDDGATVNLTLLRKGKEVKVTAKLKKKEVSAERGPFGFEQKWDFDDFGKMNFDFKTPDMATVRETVERAKAQALRAGDEARRAVRRLRVVTTDAGTTKTTKVDLGKATITFSDEQGELKLESVDGKKMLTAKDAQGKTLFNGPIDTDEQRAKLPPEVRQRFEKLENQDLPEIPPTPEAPPAPEAGESAHLESPRLERAGLAPNERAGWVRSTILL
ncbi:MAG: PDZ domain-containing protein [Chthoniobacterales bacterium]|nr:PDZ domain-containing protein [Chthoniobacterales bacterium]